MGWYLRHWYDVGLGVCVIALAWGVLADLDRVQQILLLSFGVVLLHEFEEYGWPGGISTFMNGVMRPSETPDRYPLNQMNSMVGNVVLIYPIFLAPVFFPETVWLALPPVLIGFAEVLLHGGLAGLRARALYNPGVVTLLPWLVLGIWYLIEVYDQDLVTTSDWWIGLAYFVGLVVAAALVVYKLLAGEDSRYPFTDDEMSRFEKYRHLVHAAHAHPHAPRPDAVAG